MQAANNLVAMLGNICQKTYLQGYNLHEDSKVGEVVAQTHRIRHVSIWAYTAFIRPYSFSRTERDQNYVLCTCDGYSNIKNKYEEKTPKQNGKDSFHMSIADMDNTNSTCSFFFSGFTRPVWQHNLITHIFHKLHGKGVKRGRQWISLKVTPP